jgi:hypothetical protein
MPEINISNEKNLLSLECETKSGHYLVMKHVAKTVQNV